MDRWIQNNWARKGAIKIMDLNHDFFLVRFVDEGDHKHALYEGPWLVASHCFLVRRWGLISQPTEELIQKIVVWIRIPELPVELYN